MVRRAAAVLILAPGWCLWTAFAPALGAPSRSLQVTLAILVAVPLAAALAIAVSVAVRNDREIQVLITVLGFGFAVAATQAGSPTAAGLLKLIAAGALGALIAPLIERPWHAAVVAVVVVGVDTYSVFRGPTREILRRGEEVSGWFTVPLSSLDGFAIAGLGATDFAFLSLFVALTLRWRLRPRVTIPLCATSLAVSLAAALLADRALPAIPLLSLAFVAPNLSQLFARGQVADTPEPELGTFARGPATAANARRNAKAPPERAERWRAERDALWRVLDPLLADGGTVAIVGAGSCHDLPLTRIAGRSGRVDLLDVDTGPVVAAIRDEPEALRERLRALRTDASGGAADRIVGDVVAGRIAEVPRQDWQPLGDPPYDVVIGDLLYSQLLYPGLLDSGVPEERIGIALRTYGDAVTGHVVARLHASAPRGVVVHVNDPVAWWQGHEQPFTLEEVLAAADAGADRALRLIATGNRPTGCDPREALAALGIPIVATAFWRWPFTAGVDYLVCATVARSPG